MSTASKLVAAVWKPTAWLKAEAPPENQEEPLGVLTRHGHVDLWACRGNHAAETSDRPDVNKDAA